MIYHTDIKIVQRSKGQNVIAGAAYRSGSMIDDEREGITHDYTKKSGVVYSQILAPTHAPKWVYDRQRLWNESNKADKRKDAQLAREYEFGLQDELDMETNIKLVREFLAPMIADGMIVDLNIHDDPRKIPRNIHAHIYLTMRDIGPDGFGLKRTDWHPDFAKVKSGEKKGKAFVADTGPLVDLRERWAQINNAEFERQQIEGRIDHRSYKDQGSLRIAQPKVGPRATQWGDESRLLEQRRLVQQHNALVDKVERQRSILERVRPTLLPAPTSGKQAYKRRLIEKQYKAALSPGLVSQIKFVTFPGDPDPTISFYSGGWVKDQGVAITARHADELAVRLMFDLAVAKKWDNVIIKGGPEYVTLALAEADRRGLEVSRVKQIGGGLIKYPDPQGEDEDFGPRM